MKIGPNFMHSISKKDKCFESESDSSVTDT
jgi:hypothetical protein